MRLAPGRESISLYRRACEYAWNTRYDDIRVTMHRRRARSDQYYWPICEIRHRHAITKWNMRRGVRPHYKIEVIISDNLNVALQAIVDSPWCWLFTPRGNGRRRLLQIDGGVIDWPSGKRYLQAIVYMRNWLTVHLSPEIISMSRILLPWYCGYVFLKPISIEKFCGGICPISGGMTEMAVADI